MIFKPNVLNFGRKEQSIQLDDIVTVQAKHNDFLSNKIALILANGALLEFRVPQRKAWLESIAHAVNTRKVSLGKTPDIYGSQVTYPKKPLRWYLKVFLQIVFLGFITGTLAFLFKAPHKNLWVNCGMGSFPKPW